MKNRILLAISLAVILVAIVLWAIGGRGAPGEPTQAGSEAAATAAPLVELSAAMEAERFRAPAENRSTSADADVSPGSTPPVASDARFRGRVVDARTGEPVPSAIARVHTDVRTIDAPTDAEGRFESDEPLAGNWSDIEFWNAHNVFHIRTARRNELEQLPGDAGWLARIRIGPTFRLRLVGSDAEGSGAWLLRVVESAPGARDRATAWIAVLPDDPPWVRFDDPLPEPPAGASERVEVQNLAGTLRGTAPIETIVGIHPGLVTVVLGVSSARVLGRVVDSSGQPLARAEVFAIPRTGRVGADGRWTSGETNSLGSYVIGGLTPGEYWVHARPRRGQEAQTLEIELAPGDTTAPDLVAPAVTAAGAIEGTLKATGGQDFPPAVVRLRAVDGRSYEHYDVVDPSQQGSDPGEVRHFGAHGGELHVEGKGFFEFQQVPQGEYELTVIATDCSRWSPSPLRVSPPRLDLEISREDAGEWWTANFRASDADSGEPIRDIHVQLLASGAWSPETSRIEGLGTSEERRHGFVWRFPEAARFRWNLHADGYAMASGTERDFAGTGSIRVLEVRLRKGFAARLLLRDARGRFDIHDESWASRIAAVEQPPVAGIEIRADGQAVGRSDAEGVAAFEMRVRPDRIEVVAPGWTVLGSSQFLDGWMEGDAREAVVWLTR